MRLKTFDVKSLSSAVSSEQVLSERQQLVSNVKVRAVYALLFACESNPNMADSSLPETHFPDLLLANNAHVI